MRSMSWTKLFGMILILLSVTVAVAAKSKTLGKNPGKIKGRWLEVEDVEALKAAKGVYLGDLHVDIQWKEERNEAPIEEELLHEYLHDQLVDRLQSYRVLGGYLKEAPEEGAEGYVRIEADLEVEPGSRAARYVVGMGAGKSRSILELHLVDHATGEKLGLYHGYGVGSGMGFKIAGGGARKMTQDDVQENTKVFCELLRKL